MSLPRLRPRIPHAISQSGALVAGCPLNPSAVTSGALEIVELTA